jgi:hypothetical protein
LLWPSSCCQAEVDRGDAVVVFLALADVAEAADAVVGLHGQLDLQRPHEGAEHVQQHALAAGFDHFQHVHVGQRGEDDGPHALEFGRVIDLPHRLVGLVDRVGEGQPHVARLHLELGENGVAEGFGGDAGAVGDEENCACMHGLAALSCGARELATPTIRAIIGNPLSQPPILSMHTAPAPKATTTIVPRRLHAAPVSTSGAFPCLHFSTRPPWSYRLKT